MDILKQFLGQYVEVRSQSGDYDFRDDGKLVAYDERWIQLDKNGETILFPITNVRLLKPRSSY